jgi:hypothetical protein
MKGKKTWRLSKTLARNVTFRPIEDSDVKYAWAAYRLGALPEMAFKQGLDAAAFKSAFEIYVLSNASAAWTIIADKPIGFIFGGWAPQNAYMIIIGIVWFPWASRRRIIEGTVTFFNRIRKELPYMGFASDEHKPLYDTCCAHGIMQRVGTSHSMGKRLAVFEGRN